MNTSSHQVWYFPIYHPPRKIRVRVRVRVRAIRAVRVAIALRIPLKTIARVYTHFTARSHNRRYCYDSPNNFWGVINRKVPKVYPYILNEENNQIGHKTVHRENDY